jgi:hypothetical protein
MGIEAYIRKKLPQYWKNGRDGLNNAPRYAFAAVAVVAAVAAVAGALCCCWVGHKYD